MSELISLKAFKYILAKDKVTFLCGNCLSINSIKVLLVFTINYIMLIKMCSENYGNVVQYIQALDQNNLSGVFEDAMKFAEDKELIERLKKSIRLRILFLESIKLIGLLYF